MSSSESPLELPVDTASEAPNNVTHLPGARPSEPAPAPSESGEARVWLWALATIAAVALVVVATTQYQRANALDAAVLGLNAQLENTRGVLASTEADLELTRNTLGVYAERMDQVRGRVDSIATQLGELGAIVSTDALPPVPPPPNER